MSITGQATLACLGLFACALAASAQAVPSPQTRAERARFEEPTPYAEVPAFLESVVVDAALTPGAAHPILQVLPGQRPQTRPQR